MYRLAQAVAATDVRLASWCENIATQCQAHPSTQVWWQRHHLASLATANLKAQAITALSEASPSLSPEVAVAWLTWLAHPKRNLAELLAQQAECITPTLPISQQWRGRVALACAYQQRKQHEQAKACFTQAAHQLDLSQVSQPDCEAVTQLASALGLYKLAKPLQGLAQGLQNNVTLSLSTLQQEAWAQVLLRCNLLAEAEPWVESLNKKNPKQPLYREWLNTLRTQKPWLAELTQLHAGVALAYVLHQLEGTPTTVLDVGSGGGDHAKRFAEAGHKVTCVDLGRSVCFDAAHEAQTNLPHGVELLTGDYTALQLPQQYGVVWASHVLEHQPDPHSFLKKLAQDCKPDGWLAITVPPASSVLAGGHVSLWYPPLLLYHLVLAGVDCREAEVMSYGYNHSVVVRNTAITALPQLAMDAGDITRLAPWLPEGIKERMDMRFG
jgi:SAM-dependent methyltransferase